VVSKAPPNTASTQAATLRFYASRGASSPLPANSVYRRKMHNCSVTARVSKEPDFTWRWPAGAGLLGAMVDVASFVLYLVLINSQQGDNGLVEGVVATFIGLIVFLSIYAVIRAARGVPARRLFLVAGSLNLAIGLVALLTVGILFVVAGVLLLYAGTEGTE
jgi:hypothetical protein